MYENEKSNNNKNKYTKWKLYLTNKKDSLINTYYLIVIAIWKRWKNFKIKFKRL